MVGAVRRFFDRFREPIPVDPVMSPRAVYDFGYKNGYAWGEVVGRRQAFSDLLHHLRVHGRVIDDLNEDDIQEAQVRSTH